MPVNIKVAAEKLEFYPYWLPPIPFDTSLSMAIGVLQHAPINEQGVVYLFGMVSHELGFLVEAVQTGFQESRKQGLSINSSIKRKNGGGGEKLLKGRICAWRVAPSRVFLLVSAFSQWQGFAWLCTDLQQKGPQKGPHVKFHCILQ